MSSSNDNDTTNDYTSSALPHPLMVLPTDVSALPSSASNSAFNVSESVQVQQPGAAAAAPATTTTATTMANTSSKRPLEFSKKEPTNPRKKKKRPRRVAASWNDMLARFLLHESKKTNDNPPPNEPNKGDRNKRTNSNMDSALLSFINNQRQQYKKRQSTEQHNNNLQTIDDPWMLTDDRLQILQHVRFPFTKPSKNQFDAKWQEKYQQLQQFKTLHGHCRVKQTHPTLGSWCKVQRESKKEADRRNTNNGDTATKPNKSKTVPLSQDRIDKLNAIGFCWRVRSVAPSWMERYRQLIAYQQQHGTTLVPQNYKDGLGKWVMKQRCEMSLLKRGKKSLLSTERIQMLNAIGFFWVSPRYNSSKLEEEGDDDDMRGSTAVSQVSIH